MKKVTLLFLVICLTFTTLTGCGNDNTNKTHESTNEISTDVPAEADFNSTDENMFTKRDINTDYDEYSAIKIELNGNSAETTDSSVKISDSVITITKDTTHIISGSLSNGMIIVDAPSTAKLQIVLNCVNITSKTSAPIYIKEADKVFVTLLGDNTLTSGDSFSSVDENNIDGTVFSKQDLTFNGEGTLTVSSPAGHGIVGKDDIVFIGGSYTITSASHGIEANDSVRIKGATISADTGKDGIHAENTDDAEKGFVYISSVNLKIESEGDGISSSSYIQIADGNFEINAGGGYENSTKEHSDNFGQFGGGGGMHGGGPGGPGSGMRPGSRSAEGMSFTTTTNTDNDNSTSMKGIKSGNSILISGGTFIVDSADDSVHSNISVTINGGNFKIASGDDAIHAEDTLTVTNGKFEISECYEGLEAMHIKISGGDIKVKATDDGLNAAGGTDASGTGGRDNMFGGGMGGYGGNSNGSILISGGTLYIRSSGDAIDANGTLEITGGNITTTGPVSGDTTVLDYDKSGTISGGTFIGTGSSMMAQSLDGNNQGVIALSVGSQKAGAKIEVKDKKGNVLVSHEPELEYAIVIISTPEIISGETYTVTVGSQSGEFEAN